MINYVILLCYIIMVLSYYRLMRHDLIH